MQFDEWVWELQGEMKVAWAGFATVRLAMDINVSRIQMSEAGYPVCIIQDFFISLSKVAPRMGIRPVRT